MDDWMLDKLFGCLLFEGFGEIVWIVVLVVFGVFFLLLLVVLGWVLLLGVEWVMDCWCGKVLYCL